MRPAGRSPLRRSATARDTLQHLGPRGHRDAQIERRAALRFLGVGAIGAVVVLGSLSEELVERFSTILDAAETGEAPDKAVAGRLGSWTVAVQLIYDHPLFGVGAGNFNVLYQTTANDLGIIFRGEGRSPHSLYLEIWSEHGLVGLGFFLGVFAFAARGIGRAMVLLRARGELRAEALCGAFGAALGGHLAALAFLHEPGDVLLWMLLGLSIALPAIAQRRLDGRSYGAEPQAGASLPL